MSNEILENWTSGKTLYACRFQPNLNVFLTNGASDEVWGTGGRDANDYDVTITESGSSGYYGGDFDSGGNIAAGIYMVCVYVQDGVNPADTDISIAQGLIFWDGTQEMNISTVVNNTTVNVGTSRSTFTLAAGVTNDTAYNFHIISVQDADDSHWEIRVISTYVGSSRMVVLNTPLTFLPANGDVVHIAEGGYSAASGGWW